MEPKRNRLFHCLKIILALLAVINLIALFLFHYDFPPGRASRKAEAPPKTTAPLNQESTGYTFRFASDPFIYDGSRDLDLLDGVSLVSEAGQVSDSPVFAHIITGETLTKKTILYSANTEKGQINGSRGLELSGYSGPSITLPDSLPGLTEENLDSLLSEMPDDGSFMATDGFGNDITDSVTVKTSREEGDGGRILCTFSVTNLFNDSTSATAYLTEKAEKPVVNLVKTSAIVELHSRFDPLRYVDSAYDTDGTDISRRIRVNGTVDTETPGTYTVTYTATSTDGTPSDPEELTITVR